MPPIESFMGVEMEAAKKHFYSVRKGFDITYHIITHSL